jgi:alanine racemase
MPQGAKTWIEVSSAALRNNVRALKKRVGKKVALMAVVKANAYGHGLVGTASIALRSGAAWLGVDSVDEALQVASVARKTPTLILGYTPLARIKDAVHCGARMVVYNQETIRAIAATKRAARVHIKLETGTTRQGVGEQGLRALIRTIRRFPNITIEGLSTHYANIEDTTDHTYAAAQLATFVRLSAIAEHTYGRPIPVKHTACSAAAILFSETHFSVARTGIALYGMWPSHETYVSAKERGVTLSLMPALTWKTIVAQVKMVAKGTPVSYGLTTRLTRNARIAVIPVGYWDGVDRKYSSVGAVLIRGRRAPVLGRICMNMFMVDVTDIPAVRLEDEVVLIGAQKREVITPEEFAAKIGSFNYEAVTRINPLIPRRFV